jgi:hypothetical protein
MILRADVLENNLARLDQMSHPSRRWPSGNLWYLYGGKFIGWIVDVYGPTTYAAVATDYGQNPIAWGINRSIRRATGRTYYQLYEGWKHHLEQRYTAQAAEVRARGLREGTRLTHRGRAASNPRFVPECAREGKRDELLYYSDDGTARRDCTRAAGQRAPTRIRRDRRAPTVTAVARPELRPGVRQRRTSNRCHDVDLFRLPSRSHCAARIAERASAAGVACARHPDVGRGRSSS